MGDQYCYDSQFNELASLLNGIDDRLQVQEQALNVLVDFVREIKIIMEAKSGIDTKKLYKKAAKPPEEPEYCKQPANLS